MHNTKTGHQKEKNHELLKKRKMTRWLLTPHSIQTIPQRDWHEVDPMCADISQLDHLINKEWCQSLPYTNGPNNVPSIDTCDAAYALLWRDLSDILDISSSGIGVCVRTWLLCRILWRRRKVSYLPTRSHEKKRKKTIAHKGLCTNNTVTQYIICNVSTCGNGTNSSLMFTPSPKLSNCSWFMRNWRCEGISVYHSSSFWSILNDSACRRTKLTPERQA